MMEMPNAHILVVDDNKLVLKVLEERLRSAGFDVSTALNAEQALEQLKAKLPDLIVLDVMMPGMDGYEFCRRLKSNPKTSPIPVLMLTARGDINEKVRGFEAGADDYVVKPVDPKELILRIRALLSRARAARGQLEEKKPEGHIISVFSLRGGVGKSTLVINVGISLSQLWGAKVALVDLALEADQLAMMLNLRPKHTWASLGRVGIDELDEEVVLGHLVAHDNGVRLLAAPASPVDAGLVTPKLVGAVLPILRSQFDYVVIDLSATFSETNLVAMDLSELIILVITPELAGLKAARTALDIFDSLGIRHDRIVAVLNWTFPKRGLPQQTIEDTLVMPMKLVVPYEPTAFVDAINSGIPAVLGAPTARASLEIQKFAYQLSASDMQQRPNLPASEMLARVKAALRR